MSKPEINFVHLNENWKQTIRRELVLARAFKENWGFLAPESDSQQASKHYTVATVKYINPQGGNWTVAQKRTSEPKEPTAEGEGQHLPLPAGAPRTAREACIVNHQRQLDSLRAKNPAYRTTSQQHGQRLSLEQFAANHSSGKRASDVTASSLVGFALSLSRNSQVILQTKKEAADLKPAAET